MKATEIGRNQRSPANTSLPLESLTVCLNVQPYAGDNLWVKRMMAFLESNLRHDLFGAYLHGSLATGEEIPYSDFDALVIIKEDAMRDRSRRVILERKLRRAQEFMFKFDPLQHHGWFQLPETQLLSYNNAVFPHELFAFSKSLLANQGLEITVKPRDSGVEMRQSFLSVVASFQANLTAGRALQNLYHLKNTLSLFMLLPALYVQVRDGQGIFKKYSFESARPDFAAGDWEPMARVSAIRERWHYEISPLKRWLLSRPWRLRRQLVRRLAPAVPPDLRALMTPALQAGMGRLAVLMVNRLGLANCR